MIVFFQGIKTRPAKNWPLSFGNKSNLKSNAKLVANPHADAGIGACFGPKRMIGKGESIAACGAKRLSNVHVEDRSAIYSQVLLNLVIHQQAKSVVHAHFVGYSFCCLHGV